MKAEPIVPIQQQIVLDRKGFTIHCAGNIFSPDALSKAPATVIFPFIESIFSSLLQLSHQDFPIIYPFVNGNHPLLPGYYEFRFELNENQQISWTITGKDIEYFALRT
ncbi:MAG: hypothetical protein DHS20C18_13480 [Saprospiraceae bacterium]|nr:MAG: hypothetical protein DHS20C18_13480 [Saprospiraceae bacterium]